MRKKQKVDIVTYPEMSEVEDQIIHGLVQREREWWGYKPFGFYSICTDINCATTQSIDEVYNVDDSPGRYRGIEDLERDGPLVPDCVKCHEPGRLIFEPEQYLRYSKKYFKNGEAGFGTVLVDNAGNVQGTMSSFVESRQAILETINLRRSYDISEVLQRVSKMLNESTDASTSKSRAMCWNKAGLTPHYRGGNHFFDLTKKMFEIFPEYNDLPVLTETRFDSKIYPLARAMGFKDVKGDQYGAICVLNETVGKLMSTLGHSARNFLMNKSTEIKEIRQWQQTYMRNNIFNNHQFPGVVFEWEKH